MCDPHYQKQYRAEHPVAPGSHRHSTRKHILRQYGLTIEGYDRMLAAQENRCAICRSDYSGHNGSPNYSWHVDHDHETGVVRGLLCRNCNVALGMFRDDPAVLLAAVRYLGA